jgi:Na+/melibiose symporter and related transporters
MSEEQGFYKLSWVTKIGFGLGDCAQNLIYQVIAGYVMYYYSDVYVLGGDGTKSAGIAGTLLLVARIIDVIWDPFVGAWVDKHNPRWGKYRSYLVVAGIPLSIVSLLCFSGFTATSTGVSRGVNLGFAIVSYILLQMLYTVVNVPYGAINASLTRDTHEVTELTSTRMVCANIGGFFVWTLMPLVLAIFANEKKPWSMVFFNFIGSIPGIFFMPAVPYIKRAIGKKNMFYLLGIIGIIGFAMIYFIARSVGENIDGNGFGMIAANFVKSVGFGIVTGYMWAIVPEVISYAEYTTGRRIAGIVNALTGMFYKAGNAIGGAIPGYVLALTKYDSELNKSEGSTLSKNPSAWFKTVLIYSIIGIILLIFCFTQTKERIVMDEKEAKNVKFTDLFVEFVRNGPLRVIALYFITAFTCMCCHNTAIAFLYGLKGQAESAKEGVRWAVAVIPIILNIVMMIIISFYTLTDEKIDEINRENEKRLQKADSA